MRLGMKRTGLSFFGSPVFFVNFFYQDIGSLLKMKFSDKIVFITVLEEP